MNSRDQITHIRNAELLHPDGRTHLADIIIANEKFETVSSNALPGNSLTIDANGCLVIPGLHDHHTHLIAYAASLTSLGCGPPDVTSEAELIDTLREYPGTGWLRGYGYHESILPTLDRGWLDAHAPDRPIRIQHRSGRLWILNSAGLALINEAALNLAPHERARLSSNDGRLYDVDELMGNLTRLTPPPVARASQQLASFGVTGINDLTPSNNPETWQWFDELHQTGCLLQQVRMSGRMELSECAPTRHLTIGETKVHLHDSALPDFSDFVSIITQSHGQHRNVAVHCVTEVELVFTLSAFRAAGVSPGDRIEHASVVPPALIEQLNQLELCVITQPNFVAERGDAYLADIPVTEQPYLYRIASLIDSGVPTAFGTDLPFGQPDPWSAMHAAVKRSTPSGKILGKTECITPVAALNRFLGQLASPSTTRTISPGEPADCCLLDVPWRLLQDDLSSAHVRMTIKDGKLIYARD